MINLPYRVLQWMNWDDDVSKRLPSTVSTPHDVLNLIFTMDTDPFAFDLA